MCLVYTFLFILSFFNKFKYSGFSKRSFLFCFVLLVYYAVIFFHAFLVFYCYLCFFTVLNHFPMRKTRFAIRNLLSFAAIIVFHYVLALRRGLPPQAQVPRADNWPYPYNPTQITMFLCSDIEVITC